MIELLVATSIFLIITGIVATALKQVTQSQSTIWNRTQMHSGVRGATELMQQEVGQAGRIATPVPIIAAGAIPGAGAGNCDPSHPGEWGPQPSPVNPAGGPYAPAPAIAVAPVAVSGVNQYGTDGLFGSAGAAPLSYTLLTTMDGPSREFTQVYSVDKAAHTFVACFESPHNAGTVLMALGGFANGIVPPVGVPNGSTANVLKMFGDINGDGNMVYVEYTCDTTNAHKLYRNVMAFDAVAKPPLSDALVLLSNVMPHPDGSTGCFNYQIMPDPAHVPPDPQIIVQGIPVTFVLDVAITLTVQTQQKDPVTGQFQKETKALLNVSPRNVFNSWQLAGAGYTDHMQSTPGTITALLAMP